jgi:hypothetical protein
VVLVPFAFADVGLDEAEEAQFGGGGSVNLASGIEMGRLCETKWFLSQPSVLNSRVQNSHLNTSVVFRFVGDPP